MPCAWCARSPYCLRECLERGKKYFCLDQAASHTLFPPRCLWKTTASPCEARTAGRDSNVSVLILIHTHLYCLVVLRPNWPPPAPVLPHEPGVFHCWTSLCATVVGSHGWVLFQKQQQQHSRGLPPAQRQM